MWFTIGFFTGAFFSWVYSILRGKMILRKLEKAGVFKEIEKEIGEDKIEAIRIKLPLDK